MNLADVIVSAIIIGLLLIVFYVTRAKKEIADVALVQVIAVPVMHFPISMKIIKKMRLIKS